MSDQSTGIWIEIGTQISGHLINNFSTVSGSTYLKVWSSRINLFTFKKPIVML